MPTLHELATLLGKTVLTSLSHSRDHDHRRSVSTSESEIDLATQASSAD